MNASHLRAFVWLRWRLMMNQWRRGGRINFILWMVIVVAAAALSIPLFVGAIALAVQLIPRATPGHLLFMWDGLVLGFCFFWFIGLVAELQRGDPISLSKFLHLPVSASGAYLINYLSSLARLSLLVFAPLMMGLAIALVVVKGWSQVFTPLAVLAFFLMVTSLTYQLQGWLAALMANPRKRRGIVVLMTFAIVMLVQIPNLINLTFTNAMIDRRRAERQALERELAGFSPEQRGQDTPVGQREEQERRMRELIQAYQANQMRELARRFDNLTWQVGVINMIVPIGWLPYGVMAAAEDRLLPPYLGLAGMLAIGGFSLARGYRGTIEMYQGKASSERPVPGAAKKPAATAGVANARPRSASLIEWRIPLVSEPVSAIACAGLVQQLRAPESKLLLMGPLIMLLIFGSMLYRNSSEFPVAVRPLVAAGAIAFSVLGFVQVVGNQFGIDRDGFRVYVLSSARRRDILLGKNLVYVFPTALVGAAMLILLQFFMPMRWDHLLAMVPLLASFYLVLCMLMNLMSIVTPMQVSQGTYKPVNPRASSIFVQIVLVMVVMPIVMAFCITPIVLEPILEWSGLVGLRPVGLALSVVELLIVVPVYLWVIRRQGALLQAREQSILEIVTGRVA